MLTITAEKAKRIPRENAKTVVKMRPFNVLRRRAHAANLYSGCLML